MTLILEIAAGIVVGVIALSFLPYVLFGIGAAFVVVWEIIVAIAKVFVPLTMIAFCLWLIAKIFQWANEAWPAGGGLTALGCLVVFGVWFYHWRKQNLLREASAAPSDATLSSPKIGDGTG